MQNIYYTSHTEPTGLKSTGGGRISSPLAREMNKLSEDFSGLPEGFSKYDLLLLVKKVGRFAGFSPRMIALLDYYMSFTKDIDWKQGSNPIVYQSLSKTALDMGVCERQIQKLEKQLFQIGALTWIDSGNHKRYGQRDKETGKIIYAFGVDLSPLASLKEQLENTLHEKTLYDRAWMETKRQISFFRAKINALKSELNEQGREVPDGIINAEHITSSRIRSSIALPELREIKAKHKAIYEMLICDASENQEEHEIETYESTELNNCTESQMSEKSSCRDESFVVHKEKTTYKQFNKLNSSFKNICFQEEVGQGFGSHNIKNCEETKEGYRQVEHNYQNNTDDFTQKVDKFEPNEPQSEQSSEADIILSTGLQHITLKQLLNACSERFKEYLPIEPRPMNHNDFIEAAYRIKSELYISQQSWGQACLLLGRIGAATCVILTEQASMREIDPVIKTGAYFNAMIERAKTGKLNIHKSVMGILRRENLDKGYYPD